ncbi:LysR family transcriptional regulator [Gluconacetobacter aggeris]|uniref:LysR family transcriptional regulator n=2 Tax=Gluconacetobacter aggeris TaxID=1286186 RepID=A0A7W4IQ41_9PROT|nr:LysR family transcriptional regulator [Gluconacetobacter aggeris]
MNISRMDLNLAQVFLALWHERSVSRAAVRLALTQPAVSASLRRLRALCGDELFVRTRYGMQPTSRATTMASVLEECVDTLRGALGQRGEFNPAFSSRSFVVGCDGGLDYALGPYLMAKIREVAPNVTLTARAVPADTMNLTLERREIDLAVTIYPLTRPDCVALSLASYGMVCVGDPEFVTLPEILRLEELCQWDQILIEGARQHSVFDHALRNLGFSRTIRAVVPSFGHLPLFLRKARTVAVVPEYIAHAFREMTGLCVAGLPDIVGPREIRLLSPVANRNDAGLCWLQGLVLDARHVWSV